MSVHPQASTLNSTSIASSSEILIEKDQHPSSKDKTKIKPSYYGQALTTDEIAELLLSRDEAKEAKKKAKTNSKLLYILHTNQTLS